MNAHTSISDDARYPLNGTGWEAESMALPDPVQYDTFADEYEAHAAVAPYNALYDRPATLRLLGDVRDRRVLDAACGPGFYLERLRDRGAELVGCDASPRMIELSRRRLGDTVDLRVHSLDDAFDWVPDGTVDVVLCALAYHHLNDRPGFLGEAFRMLRSGGSLVISTSHPTADWYRLGGSYFEVGTVTETWSRGWEVTTWRLPLGQLTEEFADAGFVIERLVEPSPEPEMGRSHPDTFERLSTEPGFILFRLRKDPLRHMSPG
jgi:SAM-dependent methyltransferase